MLRVRVPSSALARMNVGLHANKSYKYLSRNFRDFNMNEITREDLAFLYECSGDVLFSDKRQQYYEILEKLAQELFGTSMSSIRERIWEQKHG